MGKGEKAIMQKQAFSSLDSKTKLEKGAKK